MSETNNNLEILSEDQKLIKEFLDEVERKLPFWLKNERKNVEDILNKKEDPYLVAKTMVEIIGRRISKKNET